jgi:hypothetical protein
MGRDPLADRNAEVLAFAEAHDLTTRRQDDGEVVLALSGERGGYAGRWSASSWYWYREYELKLAATYAKRKLLDSVSRAGPGTTTDRGGDYEVQVEVPSAEAEKVLLEGPRFWRARKRVVRNPAGNPDALRIHRAGAKPNSAPETVSGLRAE